MAVKKAVKKEEVDVQVDNSVVEEQETPVETVVPEEEPVSEETNVEIEIPEEQEEEPESDVQVDLASATVDTSKKPEGNVKIRMRVDHRCNIAMEQYDLKAGKVYTVPRNVKNILNRAGLLAPLN